MEGKTTRTTKAVWGYVLGVKKINKKIRTTSKVAHHKGKMEEEEGGRTALGAVSTIGPLHWELAYGNIWFTIPKSRKRERKKKPSALKRAA